jgi:hypothetical protein
MPPEAERPAVAVVAVTHDSAHAIGSWVDALEATGMRDRMELCVVDSGSRREQLALLRSAVGDRVDVLLERPNLGYGRAGNEGAAATTAPVLLFTNPDCRVRSVPARVWAGDGLGGRVLGAFKVLDGQARRSLGFAHPPNVRWQVGSLLGSARAWERTDHSPAWVSGAALMIERSEFDRLGGFADDLFMYFEDADLCARHRAGGGAVALDDDLVVEHDSASSSSVPDRERLLSALDAINRRSGRVYARRHGRWWHAPALYALLALAYVPRRLASTLLARRGRRDLAVTVVLDLLFPGRALRRLGARR